MGQTSPGSLALTLVESRIPNKLCRRCPFATPKQASHNSNTCLSIADSTKLFPRRFCSWQLALQQHNPNIAPSKIKGEESEFSSNQL